MIKVRKTLPGLRLLAFISSIAFTVFVLGTTICLKIKGAAMLDVLNFLLFVVCVAILISGVNYLWKYHVANIAHAKRLAEEAKIADSETLDKHKWKVLEPEIEGSDTSELAERIRQSLPSKKA